MVKQHDGSESGLDVKQMVLAALLMFGFIGVASAEAPRSPVGKLMDPNGAVEYSRDGEKWRPVTRAKYFFFLGITLEPVTMDRATSLTKKPG